MDLSVKKSLTQLDLLLNIRWGATYLGHWQAIFRYVYKNVNAGSSNYVLVSWSCVVFAASCFRTKTNRSTQLDLFGKKTLSFWQWKWHVSTFSRWSSGYSYDSTHHDLCFYKNSRMVTRYRARCLVFIVKNKYFLQINHVILDCLLFIENNSL